MKLRMLRACLAGCARAARALAAAVALYAGLAYAGGTLVHSGRPVAVEAGFALQGALGVNTLIRWCDARGHDRLLLVLRAVGDGAGRPS